MGVSAVVKNGEIVETASQTSVQNSINKNGMDKEAFLQLLVAQMKYQDPLEPTSNTEYISQYATFAQVEQLQNMGQSMDLMRASALVGKVVDVQTTDSSGNTKQMEGMVEYVSYENGKAYVSIDGSRYSADDVVAVVDETYLDAFDLAKTFTAAVAELPEYEFLTVGDEEAVSILQSAFNNMTAYQQSFISESDIEKLQKYVARMAEILEAAEKSNKNDDDTDDEDDDQVDETEKPEGTNVE